MSLIVVCLRSNTMNSYSSSNMGKGQIGQLFTIIQHQANSHYTVSLDCYIPTSQTHLALKGPAGGRRVILTQDMVSPKLIFGQLHRIPWLYKTADWLLTLRMLASLLSTILLISSLRQEENSHAKSNLAETFHAISFR